METSSVISILGCIGGAIGCIMGVLSFFNNRKDKSNENTQEQSYHLGQIDTRLEKIEEVLGKIEKKLDNQDEEIDKRVNKAIDNHVKIYHKRWKWMRDDLMKAKKEIEELKEESFAISLLKDYKKQAKRQFIALIIVIILWFITIGYLVYVLNDVGTSEETMEIKDDEELALKMAYYWLDDADSVNDKLYEYWKYIAKRD